MRLVSFGLGQGKSWCHQQISRPESLVFLIENLSLPSKGVRRQGGHSNELDRIDIIRLRVAATMSGASKPFLLVSSRLTAARGIGPVRVRGVLGESRSLRSAA